MDLNDRMDITAIAPGLAEISENYMTDFMNEIRDILDEIELDLVNLETDPANSEHLNSIYNGFHTIRGLAGLMNDNTGLNIVTATEDLLETLKKYNTAAGQNAVNLILDSVKFLRKICENVEILTNNQFGGEAQQHISNLHKLKDDVLLEMRQPVHKETKIGEILVQEGAMKRSDVEDVLRKQSSQQSKMKFGEIVLREKKVDATDIIKAIRMQKVRNTGSTEQYVKIPLERLDQIIGIINNVSSIYDSIRDEAVLRFGSNDSLTMESLRAYHMIQDIRNILKELRMVTLQQTFQKLTRSACAMIEENHMEVMFSTMGENIEVDKEIADRIVVPLGELVKLLLEKAYNEKAEPGRIGNIEVVAYEEGNTVHIDITSDAYVDMDQFRLDTRYMEMASRLSAIKLKLGLDDLEGEGLRMSLVIHR